MIFVTVGTELPFNRLVRAIDEWAADRRPGEVFAQVGDTGWQPNHIDFAQFLAPAEFMDRMRSARVIVSHAGMGSILTALNLGKPLIVMPRRADCNEHRNDHQLATVRQLRGLKNVQVAQNEGDLRRLLDHAEFSETAPVIGAYASSELSLAINSFIRDPGSREAARA